MAQFQLEEVNRKKTNAAIFPLKLIFNYAQEKFMRENAGNSRKRSTIRSPLSLGQMNRTGESAVGPSLCSIATEAEAEFFWPNGLKYTNFLSIQNCWNEPLISSSFFFFKATKTLKVVDFLHTTYLETCPRLNEG